MLREWKYKYRQCCCKALVLPCCIMGSCALLFLCRNNQSPTAEPFTILEPRLLLWWTTFNETIFYRNIHCGFHICTITNDRRRLGEAKVIFFYGSDINVHEMPLPRHEFQLWALLHDQSPQMQPLLFYNHFLRHFNYSSTFSRYSDFPLTLQHPVDARAFTTSKYLVMLHNRSSTPILFMQGDCDTMSGRENYVRELMAYVPVHSCGECLRNADAPSFRRENDLLRFMAKFKFILAFEDAICDDYITNTYWLSLIVGAIPIYFGSPSIRDWAPHNRSAIYITDYQSPKDLAEHIYYLDSNDTAFNDYLRHKYDANVPITNQRLLNSLMWSDDLNFENKFEKFERQMCEQINLASKPKMKMANQTHLDCPLPQLYPAGLKNKTQHANYWKIQFSISKCIVHLLDRFLQMNAPYKKVAFVRKLRNLAGWGVC